MYCTWRGNHCKSEADLCAVLKLLVFTDIKLALAALGIWWCLSLNSVFLQKPHIWCRAYPVFGELFILSSFPTFEEPKLLTKQHETEPIFVILFNWNLLPVWKSWLAIKGMWQLCQSLHKYCGALGFLLSLAAVNTMELYTGARTTLMINVCISN